MNGDFSICSCPSLVNDETMRLRSSQIRFILTTVVLVLVVAALVIAFRSSPELEWEDVLETLESWGILPFYIGLIFLPLFGAPITPFYILAGAAFPLGQNVILLAVSLLIHFNLAYFFSAYLFRKPLLRLFSQTRFSLPTVRPHNHFTVALLVRLAPGVAVFIKSYVLGAIGIRYPVYISVSWVTTLVFSMVVLLLGKSLLEGDWGWFVVLLIAMFGLGFLAKWILQRLRRSHPEDGSFGEVDSVEAEPDPTEKAQSRYPEA
jgi:uncharacterized membrane protein YdjX (TVP38/TMEM64 family)